MRIALHSEIVPGMTDDYEREHARIPDDLQDLFARAGVSNWTIWRSGERLFHLVECDNFDAAMQIIRNDPADERWQRHIGRFVAGFRDGDGADDYAPLPAVWELRQQNGAERG